MSVFHHFSRKIGTVQQFIQIQLFIDILQTADTAANTERLSVKMRAHIVTNSSIHGRLPFCQLSSAVIMTENDKIIRIDASYQFIMLLILYQQRRIVLQQIVSVRITENIIDIFEIRKIHIEQCVFKLRIAFHKLFCACDEILKCIGFG